MHPCENYCSYLGTAPINLLQDFELFISKANHHRSKIEPFLHLGWYNMSVGVGRGIKYLDVFMFTKLADNMKP